MKLILFLGLLLYLYGLCMCFDLNPLGLHLFPGLVAGAGAVLLMVGFGMWAGRKHARPV
jgi:predicted tellurium resistance membrane protein TerC